MPYKSIFTKCSYRVLCLNILIVSVCICIKCTLWAVASHLTVAFTSLNATFYSLQCFFRVLLSIIHQYTLSQKQETCSASEDNLFLALITQLSYVSNNVSWSRQPPMHEIKLHSTLFLIEYTILLRKCHIVGQLVAYAAVSLAKEETKLFENPNLLCKLVC